MDYYTALRKVGLGILGEHNADVEYVVVDGKPQLIGVWLYDFAGSNHAIDVTDIVTDKAYDEIMGGLIVDHLSRLQGAAEYLMEDR